MLMRVHAPSAKYQRRHRRKVKLLHDTGGRRWALVPVTDETLAMLSMATGTRFQMRLRICFK